MNLYHVIMADWLSACFWMLPEVDYWQIWSTQTMHSNVLPYVTGI